jgi:hypothetical protein
MKILITSGCSFSDPMHWPCWPTHLSNYLGNDYQSRHLGMISQGNGIISRKLIHKVIELLKENSADNLLVGIMWSGITRVDFYNDTNPMYHPSVLQEKFRHFDNPTGFVDDKSKHWVIFNHNWNIPNCQEYYKIFDSVLFQQIQTIEHILRTQWFLEKHNIKYFMSTYTGEVFDKKLLNHLEVEYLYKQINFDTFLPVIGEFEWCRDFSNFEFPMKGDHHPGSDQHNEFSEQVIIPFLQKKQYI